MTENARKLNFKAEFLQSTVAVLCGAAVLSAAFAMAVSVQAKVDDDPRPETASVPAPYAELQYATVTGSTNGISVTMLPVVLSNGTIVYKNLAIPIEVTESSTGVVTITTGTVAVAAAPTPQISGFKAGNYAGPGGGTGQLLTLTGPGVTANGATEWSVSTTAGETGCSYPTTANFYVGPIASNPLYSRLKAAGITAVAGNAGYYYGMMGQQTCAYDVPGNWWANGNLVGFSQNGNALTIVSFTNNGNDQATPGSQITYIYQ